MRSSRRPKILRDHLDEFLAAWTSGLAGAILRPSPRRKGRGVDLLPSRWAVVDSGLGINLYEPATWLTVKGFDTAVAGLNRPSALFAPLRSR